MVPKPNLSIFDPDNKPKDEVNYCVLLYMSLQQSVSARAAELFKNDPSIKVVWNSAGGFQRLFCNRYFLHILSKYTFYTGKSTLNEIFILCDDGGLDAWFGIIIKFILPFLNDNNVYDIVHPIEPQSLIN